MFATESVEDGTESITEDIYTCEDAPGNRLYFNTPLTGLFKLHYLSINLDVEITH